jgi:hypothetical protein
VLVVDELPRNALGKVEKARIRNDVERQATPRQPAPP